MISVFTTELDLVEHAKAIAHKLNAPFVSNPSGAEAPYLLELSSDGLSLRQSGPKAPGPVRVDFESGAVAHRRRFGGGKGQQIAKACGVSSNFLPHVADLTAGLGKDSFVLATLGCKVDLIERVPLVHALLEDGINRARQSSDQTLIDIVNRMTLMSGEAVDHLAKTDARYDVIYLDPMFPHSKKTAQVKKEMLAFRSLVGPDSDSAELLRSALLSDPARIVVKRPRKAPFMGDTKPSYSLEGKSGRFDIYALRKLSATTQ